MSAALTCAWQRVLHAPVHFVICLLEGEHNIDPVERLQELLVFCTGLSTKLRFNFFWKIAVCVCKEELNVCLILTEKASVVFTHHSNCKTQFPTSIIYLSSDLGLQNVSRWDIQRHKLTGVMHSEVVCLSHEHLADCQSSIIVAASFG